jgi:hypothetical protein
MVQKPPTDDSAQPNVPKHKLALVGLLLVMVVVPIVIVAYVVYRLSQIH